MPWPLPCSFLADEGCRGGGMWGGWPNATPVPFPPVGYRATAVLSYGRRGVGALLPPAPSHSHHPAHQAGTLMNKMPLETRLAATDPPPTLPSLPVVLPLQPCARVDPPPRPSPLLPNSILPGREGGGATAPPAPPTACRPRCWYCTTDGAGGRRGRRGQRGGPMIMTKGGRTPLPYRHHHRGGGGTTMTHHRSNAYALE